MKLRFLLTCPFIQRLVYSAASLLMALTFVLSSHPGLSQSGGIYSTPGLYAYTVPAGGPYQIRVTARGGDGGGRTYEGAPKNGGSGASVGQTFTVQSGDVLTLIVGQSGGSVFIRDVVPSNGGGGGGSAVVVTRNGTRTLLVAAGGGGGAGSMMINGIANITAGGGGQGIGSSSGGTGGTSNSGYSGSGGGGGLAGSGGNGNASTRTGFGGGAGGGAASLTAVSTGGTYRDVANGYGGSGFGGGGGVGGYDSSFPYPVGGGGGGYGGGNGAGVFIGEVRYITQATGGYSYVSPTGSATTVSPGTAGVGQNQNGLVTLVFPNNTATAAFSTTSRSICPGSSTTLQGTISATGSWTLVLSDGTVGTGSGSSFSIPVSPVTSTTYTIASLTDQTFVKVNNLPSRAIVTTISKPAVNLTNNGPLSCAQTSVTLTASGGTSYTFSSGNTILSGANTGTTRAVSNPGEYTVRVTGANSCTNSTTTTVTQSNDNPLTVSLSSKGALTCKPSSVTLTATSNGSSYTFTSQGTILPGDPSSNTRIVSNPGEYTVEVSGIGSCIKSATLSVEPVIDPPRVFISTPNGTQLSCSSPSVEILAYGLPGAANSISSYTYTYGNSILSGDPYDRVQVVTNPGVYTVRVTGANSCTNSASITVTSSVSIITVSNPAATSLVVGQTFNETFTASGGAAPYSFSVTSGNLPPGLSLSTTGQLSGTLTQAGDFTVVVQARDVNGCTGQGLPYVVHVADFTTFDLTPILYARPTTVSGNAPLTVVVDVAGLNSVATSGLITVKVTKDNKASLRFDKSLTTLAGRSIQNSSWSFATEDGYYVLTTSQSIAGGDQLSFGLSGLLSPGATSGVLTVSAIVMGGSGGEVRLTNNTDADKIDYFQQ